MAVNRIERISVSTPQGEAGWLEHQAQYVFSYKDAPKLEPGAAVSLTMPVRLKSYSKDVLHPIFQMNLPEGYLRRFIGDRLMQEKIRINDMLLLAIQGRHGIGRPIYESDINLAGTAVDSLDEILHWQGRGSLFSELAQRHLLNTTLSGIQPKLAVNERVTIDNKTAIVRPELIVKTGGEEYPKLAFNEFVCMSIAKHLNLSVPEFWLSDNRDLFISRRFDIAGERQYGMEDFLTLMGKTETEQQGRAARYQGSYEAAARLFALYQCQAEEIPKYFDYVALSCLIGNGDAHLKNFSLMYTDVESAPFLSPLYDLVCTTVYLGKESGLALKLAGDRRFPTHNKLTAFANALGLPAKYANVRLKEMADQVQVFIDQFDGWGYFHELKDELLRNLSHTVAMKQSMVGYRASVDRHKKRKSDSDMAGR